MGRVGEEGFLSYKKKKCLCKCVRQEQEQRHRLLYMSLCIVRSLLRSLRRCLSERVYEGREGIVVCHMGKPQRPLRCYPSQQPHTHTHTQLTQEEEEKIKKTFERRCRPSQNSLFGGFDGRMIRHVLLYFSS
jgi:hypothetical protein